MFTQNDLRSNYLAFDIGANIGKCSRTLCGTYDKVVAVEPIKSCAENIMHLNLSNLIVLNCVISNKEGKLNFFECDTISTVERSWVENSRFTNKYKWKSGYEVDAITIDKLVESYGTPDFIKIDVEGHELEVLEGMKTAYAKVIAFEWAEEFAEKTKKCINLLCKLGYFRYAIEIMNDDISYDPNPHWKSSEEALAEIDSLLTGNQVSWGMIWASK